MALDKATFTGVDAETKFDELRGFYNDYPFTEFGVLLSRKHAGTGAPNLRYPSLAYITDIAGRLAVPIGERPQMALHICGSAAIDDFLYEPTSHTVALARQFDRVQLNLKEAEINVLHLNNAIRREYPRSIITQHNDNNPTLYRIGALNHELLIDASGGVGLLPKTWPQPPTRIKRTSFAGGIGPDNIEEELPRIRFAATYMGIADPIPSYGVDISYGVDMETKVRDEGDRFSLPLCRKVAVSIRQLTPGL